MPCGADLKGKTLELILSHDGHHWMARGEGMVARAPTLSALDNALFEELRARLPIDVLMYFDRDSLPRWMRQYGAHYFNRRVHFNIPEVREESR